MSAPGSEPLVAPGRPFVTILRYNRRYAKPYLIGAMLSAVYIVVSLAMPFVVREVIDRNMDAMVGEVDRAAQSQVLWLLFFALVVIGVVAGVARFFERVLMIGASREFEYDLRNDYFRHIQRMSRAFFNRTKTGEIMARATNDLNFVRMFIGPGIMGTVDLLRVPVTLGVMVYFSAKLTLVALIPLPIVAFFVYWIIMYMHRKSQEVQEIFGDVTARAQENLAGARVVKAYGIADRETRAFRTISERYMRESLKLAVVQSLTWPVIGLLIGLTVLIVLWQGGGMVIDGALTLPDFSGFIFCLLMLAFPLAEFGWVLTLYQRGAVGMNRISEFMAQKPDVAEGPDTRHDTTAVEGSVEFDQVSFRYSDVDVLNNVSFTVPAGQTVAIVGPTGAGKSTIVSLLLREYDPTNGRVILDGHDLKTTPLQALRDAVGYVPQDTFLFSDTVGNNLTFGRPDATRAEMDDACDVAQFSEALARLPKGYDTLLGERGINLSGGQKQRLAIARAVVRQPRILVLDDALSAVDTHTEEQILQRMKDVARGRTTVIIAHRISAIRHADQIVYLEDGRIVERGVHDELVAAGGPYAAMYERQLLEEELEETP